MPFTRHAHLQSRLATGPVTDRTITCAAAVRYAVYDCEDDEGLIEFFFDEALRLLREPSEKLATTMLITPRYTGDINEFYELYEWLTDTLEGPEEEVLNNQVNALPKPPPWQCSNQFIHMNIFTFL